MSTFTTISPSLILGTQVYSLHTLLTYYTDMTHCHVGSLLFNFTTLLSIFEPSHLHSVSGWLAPMTSSPSADGLKFGEKIYFEDVNVNVVAHATSSSGKKKGKGGGVQQGSQPPRCQVEGCKVDLSGSKPYYSRHKVCAIHSKSPTVVVAGLNQRFCQQCSRFHQLPEFDQGKRSCRRRLAGHNERRRKPQPSSLLTSRFARLSSPTFDNNGQRFLMEFASYPKHSLRSSEPVYGNQTASFPWHASETPSDFFLQGSMGGTNFLGPPTSYNPTMESYNEVANSSRALSLLSNQSWSSRNTTPNVHELNNLLNFNNGTFMTQLAASSSQGAVIHQLPTASWFLKGIDSVTTSPEVVPDLGLGQPLHNHLPGESDLSHGRRYYMDLGLSRTCESPHWSL